jgi:KUP system potassium uptake protein
MTSKKTLATSIAALGVVYGDIGTSPLYAFRESLNAAGSAEAEVVYGVLSLIAWTLFVLVTIKYVMVMLRADNEGEGGILALVSLLHGRLRLSGPWPRRVLSLGVLGAALFYCDALITPAISVLSAVEGVELLGSDFHRYILPVTLGIVVGLFSIQRHGTESVGRLFGPIMMLWFVSLGVMGALAIARAPAIIAAVDPRYAIALLRSHAPLALAIMGGAFLAVTGAEALYADMGHFGRGPVRVAWLVLVWPALMLNYFGQGAYLLHAPMPVENAFFALVPPGLLPALIVLATAATVIASQATISGAFSVTRQAVQLDLLPRVRVLQTSASSRGQIYVPVANAFMFVAVVLLVLGFRTSAALSAAYGAAVVGTMLITTLLGALLARVRWQWTWWKVAPLFGPLMLIEIAFTVANATKIPHGGWVPLLIAALMFLLFVTWRDGRQRLRQELERRAVPIARLPQLLANATGVPGTAVFLVSTAGYVPSALLRNLEHNRVRHENIVILNMEIMRTPRHDPAARTTEEQLFPGVYSLRARFGFMETPEVSEALRAARRRGMRIELADVSYFVGWHLVRARQLRHGSSLRMRVFAYLQSRSTQAAEFFRMPARGVIVLGTDIEL